MSAFDTVTGQFPAIVEQIAPGILDQANKVAAAGDSWIDAITKALPTVVMADSQRRLLNVQIDRANKGLPPLDVSQYGLYIQAILNSIW